MATLLQFFVFCEINKLQGIHRKYWFLLSNDVGELLVLYITACDRAYSMPTRVHDFHCGPPPGLVLCSHSLILSLLPCSKGLFAENLQSGHPGEGFHPDQLHGSQNVPPEWIELDYVSWWIPIFPLVSRVLQILVLPKGDPGRCQSWVRAAYGIS